jgi:5-methylcytosine-specific restriction endonuclease McrA
MLGMFRRRTTPEIETKSGMIRKGTYSTKRIFKLMKNPLFKGKKRYIILDGDNININSMKYRLFAESIKCVKCGISGSFFAKERHKGVNHYHLNLYALKKGREVLMTKDHTLPKGLGGKNVLSNYEPMCQDCNSKKKDKLDISNKKNFDEVPLMHMVTLREGYIREVENKLNILSKGIQKKEPKSLRGELLVAFNLDRKNQLKPILKKYDSVIKEFNLLKKPDEGAKVASEISIMHMVSLRQGYIKEIRNKINYLKDNIQKKKPTVLKREIKFAMKIDKEHKLDSLLIEYIDVVEKHQLIGIKKIKRLKEKIEYDET